MRLVHTVLFEIGLLAILLPPIAWYLNMGLLQTLQLDLAIVAFYLVYNFVFNLAYDRVFPIPGRTASRIRVNAWGRGTGTPARISAAAKPPAGAGMSAPGA